MNEQVTAKDWKVNMTPPPLAVKAVDSKAMAMATGQSG
jgi:hypothetical protein